MEAIVFDGVRKVLRYEECYRLPEITRDKEVMIRVRYAGICGTDVHIIKGQFPALQDTFILGHELSGVVHEVGPNSAFQVGDNVAVDPNRPCSECRFCRRGAYQHCCSRVQDNVGVFRNGGWAQFVVVDEQQVYLLPEELSLEQGVLCEVYSCIVHGVKQLGEVDVTDKVLIAGDGIVGHFWAITFHYKGLKDVTVAGKNRCKLDIIEKQGCDFRLMSPDDLREDDLFDIIVDCTGSAKALEKYFKHLDFGARYLVFGCSDPKDLASINPFDIYKKEVKIIGAKVNPYTFATAIEWLKCLGDRYISFAKLGVTTYKMNQYQEALRDLEWKRTTKAVLLVPPENNVNPACPCPITSLAKPLLVTPEAGSSNRNSCDKNIYDETPSDGRNDSRPPETRRTIARQSDIKKQQ